MIQQTNVGTRGFAQALKDGASESMMLVEDLIPVLQTFKWVARRSLPLLFGLAICSMSQAQTRIPTDFVQVKVNEDQIYLVNSKESLRLRPKVIQDKLDLIRKESRELAQPLPPVILVGQNDDPGLLSIKAIVERNGFKTQVLDSQGSDQELLNIDETKIENNEAKTNVSKFKQWWARKYVPPDSDTIFFGKLFGSYKLVTGAAVWFSVGIDPAIASALVLGQAAFDLYWTRYQRTIENILSGRSGLDDRSGEVQELIENGKRILISLTMTYFWRAISTIKGAYDGIHSLMSVQGHFEVWINVLLKAIPGTMFGTRKPRVLSFENSARFGVVAFAISTVLSTADLAGLSHYSWLFDLHLPYVGDFVLRIKDTNLANLGFWTIMISLLKFAPSQIERTMEALFHKIYQAKSTMSSVIFPNRERQNFKRDVVGGAKLCSSLILR